MHTHKHISEYVGAKYKHDGDISSSIINEKKVNKSKPSKPEYADPAELTLEDQTERMIFKGLIDSYIKRVAALDKTSRRPIILSSVNVPISYRAS